MESVVHQSSAILPIEVIVVKDFADASIDSYLRKSEILCIEPAGARLGGWISQVLPHAKAPVLAFLDDDDLYCPGRLAAIDREFRERPNVGYFRNDILKFSQADGKIPDRPPDVPSRVWRVGDSEKDPRTVEAMWRTGAAFNQSSIAVRRELVEQFRTELEQLVDGYSTFLFYAALISRNDMVLDPRRWTMYRLHPGNSSHLADGPRRQRWVRAFRLADARAKDAGAILDMVRRRRPGVWTRPLERVRARNDLYLAWMDLRPSRKRRAQALAALIRADEPRNLRADIVNLALGGLAVAVRRWIPMSSARSGPGETSP